MTVQSRAGLNRWTAALRSAVNVAIPHCLGGWFPRNATARSGCLASDSGNAGSLTALVATVRRGTALGVRVHGVRPNLNFDCKGRRGLEFGASRYLRYAQTVPCGFEDSFVVRGPIGHQNDESNVIVM